MLTVGFETDREMLRTEMEEIIPIEMGRGTHKIERIEIHKAEMVKEQCQTAKEERIIRDVIQSLQT